MNKHPRTDAIIKGTLSEFTHVRLRIVTDLAASLEEELADVRTEADRMRNMVVLYEENMTDQQILRIKRIQSCEQDSAS